MVLCAGQPYTPEIFFRINEVAPLETPRLFLNFFEVLQIRPNLILPCLKLVNHGGALAEVSGRYSNLYFWGFFMWKGNFSDT